MGLADDFQEIIDSMPSDWTDLVLDLRVDESRYLDAATLLVLCNPQPYSKHDWHWRINVANTFGHAASAPATHAALKALDREHVPGELVLREMRAGRDQVRQMWGRPESVKRELRRLFQQ